MQVRFEQRITIVRGIKPRHPSINEELQWFGNALGLFGARDKDKSCFRIFIELLKSAKKSQPLTSDDLSYRLGLTRATVIHHLNRLMEGGMVLHDGRKYLLRVDSLTHLVDEVQKDLARTFNDLREIAGAIDKRLGQ